MKNRRLRTLWFAFVTSTLVTIPLAFVLTLYNLGFGPNFVHAYVANSVIAIVVSTFVSIPATPLAMKILGMNKTRQAAERYEPSCAKTGLLHG